MVAFAEITGDPEVRTDEANPFWIEASDGSTPKARVPVRYILPAGLPLWVDNTTSGNFLKSLSVARAQGGTLFKVTPQQWNTLTGLVQLDVPSPEEKEATDRSRYRRLTGGQGFGLSPRERAAVETHAMHVARAYLESEWDQVTDVSANLSFDFLCSRGAETLRVEVKGTTSAGTQVVLTKNEAREARVPRYALFVVSEIQLDRSQPEAPLASKGVGRYFRHFDLEGHKLTPISFTCELDLEQSEVVVTFLE